MTVSFFKLHVSGDDFILVDRGRQGHEELLAKSELLAPLAAAMLDRGRGVGGRAVIFIAEKDGAMGVRVFEEDGSERYGGGDAFLCVARWASDSGRASGGKVRLSTPSGDRLLSALNSRSFALEVAAPAQEKDGRMELLLDGKPETAFILNGGGRWAATIGRENGPAPKRVREALAVAVPDAVPVIARPCGRDLLRFSTVDGADRLGAAAAAAAAGILAGKTDQSVVAEWRGRGAAVSFADFGGADKENATAGQAALIDRGRFFVEAKDGGRMLIAGTAEYAFEGSYDYFL